MVCRTMKGSGNFSIICSASVISQRQKVECILILQFIVHLLSISCIKKQKHFYFQCCMIAFSMKLLVNYVVVVVCRKRLT